jgi:hypothetical protein
MSQYEDRLKDYVDVKERIRLFYEKHPDGRLVTADIRFTSAPTGSPDGLVDGTARVMVHARAYRTPDDPLPGDGWSWMNLPGTTNFTRGSELENTETSAWGRAIGALGIGIDKSIASANEIANKEEPLTPASQNAKEREQLAAAKPSLVNGDGSLIGTAELAKDFPDFLPKMSPDGSVLAFKLVSPAGGIKVIAKGDLAYVLSSLREGVIGQRVSCWGKIRDETFTKLATTKSKAFTQTYQVLDLERIKGPEFILPAQEAETVPLFEGPLFDQGIPGIGSASGEL